MLNVIPVHLLNHPNSPLLPTKLELKKQELTLFRLPGPVLIIVYKLSPELLESEYKNRQPCSWNKFLKKHKKSSFF